jgi:hypothetical protein
MRRNVLALAALAGLLSACLALPAVASPEAAPALVRLAAPAEGASLRAGALAELAWEPLAATAHAEEWEAFLSLDGGAHYTIRITPHLDRDLRRVLWQVPATPTRDARLLLRFGNEREETAVELPQRFSIAGSGGPPGFEAAPVRLALGRGEPALPGHAGVVAWIEGDRRGGSAHAVVATEPPSAQSLPSIAESAAERAALETTPRPTFDPAAETSGGPVAPSAPSSALAIPERTRSTSSIPILLQSRRRNE